MYAIRSYYAAKKKESQFKIVFAKMRVIVQSALIGLGIGSLPGVGEDVAAWVAYDAAKKTSKQKEKFGTGIYEGVIAPEVGNNAAIGGALVITSYSIHYTKLYEIPYIYSRSLGI